MRNSLRLASILVAFILVMAGCKPNPVEKISKKWKPVDATGNGISPEVKEGIVREGNLMEFRKDGMFISSSSQETSDTGSYKLSDDGKTLVIRSSNDRETKLTVNELKTNRLIVENNGLVLVLEPTK